MDLRYERKNAEGSNVTIDIRKIWKNYIPQMAQTKSMTAAYLIFAVVEHKMEKFQ